MDDKKGELLEPLYFTSAHRSLETIVSETGQKIKEALV